MLKWSLIDAVEESTIHGCTVVERATYACVRSLEHHTGVVRRLWPSAARIIRTNEAARRVLELELEAELMERCEALFKGDDH